MSVNTVIPLVYSGIQGWRNAFKARQLQREDGQKEDGGSAVAYQGPGASESCHLEFHFTPCPLCRD